MSRRAARIVNMARRAKDADASIVWRLDVPKYDSTMGTSQMDRTIYMENNAQLLTDPSKTQETVEDNYTILQNYDFSELDLNNVPIVMMEDIQSVELNTDGTIIFPPADSSNRTDKEDTTIENSISNSESSILESSGTEYVPSNVTSSSEECLPIEDPKARDIHKELPITSPITIPKDSLTILKNTNSNVQEPVVTTTSATTNQITIKPTIANAMGIRVKDKVHCCYFCNKFIQQMAIHFEIKHSNELEVARLLAMPKKNKSRREGFGLLIRIGDFHHNCEVIEKKEGEIILVRKPNQKSIKDYTQYGPCPKCLGFFLKELLWHHIRYSCKNSENNTNCGSNNALSQSNALMASTVGKDNPEFYEHIIATFNNDTISLVCKQDSLINRFGRLQFEKYHKTQSALIRQTMRQLARLLIELRKVNPINTWLATWLKPEYFDDIINSIKNLCKFNPSNTSRPEFSTPSLALKLGHALKKCIAIEKGFCLRKGDVSGVQRLTSFLTLMDLEWSIRVSSNALNTLHSKKINAVELLPVTEDLVKLNTFINNKILFYKEALKLASSKYEQWRKLAMYVLCKIVLFNKRRSGEAARMTVTNYTTRPNWSQTGTSEYKQSMSALELELANSLSLVQIIGKRGRIVTVLLTTDIKEAIDLLLETRNNVNIPHDNIYLFAAGGGSLSHLRGHDALRICCSEADLIRPDLINSTKLRKYVATVCQIFNLSENETDWLARHLGHDIRVHRDFYRLHDSSIELTKISRILLAVEKGEVNKFAGKTLSEIAISDLPGIEDPDVQSDEEAEEDSTQLAAEKDLVQPGTSQPLGNIIEETFSSCDENEKENDDDYVPQPRKKNYKLKKEKTKKEINQTRKIFKKRIWSTEETKVVLEFFRSEIKEKTIPGKNKCEDCINTSNNILSTRSWKDVKYHVKNYIAKISRNKVP